MSRTLLLREFSRIEEAPDALLHLRRFVLDLAVRGRLTKQLTSDEPASSLLSRIQKELAKVKGRRRKSIELPPVGEDEAPFCIPEGWIWTRVRQVTADRGQIIPRSEFTYIDVTSIDKELGRLGHPVVVSPDDAPSRARKVVSRGDVLYSCVRPYLLNTAVVETDLTPPPIASTAFAVLDGFGLLEPRFLWAVLRSPYFVACVEDKMRGQAYPAINDSDFAQLPVPLPPPEEQSRIVERLNELMVLCDQLEQAHKEREDQRDALRSESLHRLTSSTSEADRSNDVRFFLNASSRLITKPEHVQLFRDRILSLAVLGRLVPHDSDEGNGQTLLNKIARSRQGNGQRKPLALQPGENPLPSLPAAWAWTSIDEVSSVESNAITDGPFGANLKTAHYISAPGYRIVRLQNIGHGAFRASLTTFITQEHWERLTRHHVVAGDLVVAGLVDPTVRACELPTDIGPAVVKADCYRFHVHSEFVSRFALYYLNSPVCQEFASVHHHGMTLTRLGLGNFRRLPIPVPPIEEQLRIVAKIDELMTVCDGLETALVSAQHERARLLVALLHESLKGN
jgi:type I restriction enzyme S subunit